MRRGIVKGDAGHMRQLRYLIGHSLRPVVGRVREHDICAGKGRELLFHYRKAAARVGICREKGRDVLIDLYLAYRHCAVHAGRGKHDHHQHTLIDDEF